MVLAVAGTVKNKLSTAELIADELRRSIFLGSIKSGEQLKQNDVATHFGVSASPVREALQRLIADGLAVLHPNRGVTVTIATEHDFLELSELRQLLEPHALRLSAPQLTKADYRRAEELLSAADETSDLLERARLHWEFHRTLYQKADRPRLLAQIASLYQSINRYLLPVWSKDGLSNEWCESHRIFITATRTGDIERATQLLIEQTVASTQRVINNLRNEAKK